MNKKLIIAAVSAAVAVPVVSFADTTAYGRVRSIYQDSDKAVTPTKETGSNVNTDIRIGLKANGDIGNGLTVHGTIELTIDPDSDSNTVSDPGTDDEAVNGTIDVRVSKVGLSGEFGTVQVGQMWSGYFNTFGTMVSVSNNGNSIDAQVSRTGNTIQYTNSFGPAVLYVDARVNDKPDSGQTAESGLGIGLALNPIDALTIGLATDTAKSDAADDVKNTGIAARYTLGNGLYATIGVQSNEKGTAERDDQFLWIGGPITSNTKWLLGSYEKEDQAKVKGKETTWGIYHTIGGGLSIYYEGDKYEASPTTKSVSKNTVGMTLSF